MKIRSHLVAFSVGALLLSQASAQTFTWTGAVDNDWANTANWVGGVLPTVTTNPPDSTNNVLNNTSQLIVVQASANDPATNLPTIGATSSGSTGSARFDVETGASLSLVSDGSNMYFNSMNRGGTAFTVASGGTLSFTAPGLIRTARTGTNAFQTLDVFGTINFTSTVGNMQLANQDDRLSIWNIDGGIANISAGTLFANASTAGDYTSTGSQINLSNGGSYNVIGIIANTNGDDGGKTLVVDIQDTASSFNFEAGGDFADLTAVEAAFGSFFTTSTPGLSLEASQDGSIFTVAAIPEPATTALVIGAGLLGLVAYKRRRA